jgi:hypothetical protein
MVNPQWDERVDAETTALGNNQIARGFFGQMPGAAQILKNTARLNAGRVSEINRVAQGLIDSSRGHSLAQKGLNTQTTNAGINNLFGAGGMFGNLDKEQYDQTGITYRRPMLKFNWGSGGMNNVVPTGGGGLRYTR